MKKNNFKIYFYLLSVGVILLVLLIFVTIPKFIILDRILNKNGVYILPKSVKEGLLSIDLLDTTIYDKTSKIAKFEHLKINLHPISVEINGRESTGYIKFNYNFIKSAYKIKAKELNAFSAFTIRDAEMEIHREITGYLNIKNLKTYGANLEEINITFNGKNFYIQVLGKDFNSKGSGLIVINKNNPFESTLNGEIIDSKMKFILSGTLKRLNFDVKPL